jgi:hypothetical protein
MDFHLLPFYKIQLQTTSGRLKWFLLKENHMRRLFGLATALAIVISGLSAVTANANGCSLAGTSTVVTGIGTCSGAITIPDGVTTIANGAFQNSTLVSIIIPNTVISIGAMAFAEANTLRGIVIPNSVTEIGVDAFVGIGTLESITVDSANPNYRDIDGVLFNKLATQLITYPASKAVTSYDIPNSVTEIVRRSFWGAGRLTRIAIPDSVTSIGNQAFLYTGGLASITIPNSVTFVDDNAFQGSAIVNITFPSSVTFIGNDIFLEANALKSVRFLGAEAPIASDRTLNVPESTTGTINPGATGFTPTVAGKWRGLILVTAGAGLLASEAAASVDVLIVALPALNSIITADSTSITAARAAFNALNVAAKDLVTSLSILVAAEEKLLSLINSAADSIVREAIAKREVEKKNARTEIFSRYENSERIPFELFAQAEIAGITKENYEAVQAEIVALAEASREDLFLILKIARKYEVIGIVASERVISIHSSMMIEIGLIPEDSKHKAALTAFIKKLPVIERSSYAGIKEAIDNEMAEIQARKDRYAAILARITSRNG